MSNLDKAKILLRLAERLVKDAPSEYENAALEPNTDRPLATPEKLQSELNRLHDIDGLTWEKIAQRSEYKPIPFGTLIDIARTGRIPPKWRERLRIGRVSRKRISVHMERPESASDSIVNNIDPEKAEEIALLILIKLQDKYSKELR